MPLSVLNTSGLFFSTIEPYLVKKVERSNLLGQQTFKIVFLRNYFLEFTSPSILTHAVKNQVRSVTPIFLQGFCSFFVFQFYCRMKTTSRSETNEQTGLAA